MSMLGMNQIIKRSQILHFFFIVYSLLLFVSYFAGKLWEPGGEFST